MRAFITPYRPYLWGLVLVMVTGSGCKSIDLSDGTWIALNRSDEQVLPPMRVDVDLAALQVRGEIEIDASDTTHCTSVSQPFSTSDAVLGTISQLSWRDLQKSYPADFLPVNELNFRAFFERSDAYLEYPVDGVPGMEAYITLEPAFSFYEAAGLETMTEESPTQAYTYPVDLEDDWDAWFWLIRDEPYGVWWGNTIPSDSLLEQFLFDYSSPKRTTVRQNLKQAYEQIRGQPHQLQFDLGRLSEGRRATVDTTTVDEGDWAVRRRTNTFENSLVIERSALIRTGKDTHVGELGPHESGCVTARYVFTLRNRTFFEWTGYGGTDLESLEQDRLFERRVAEELRTLVADLPEAPQHTPQPSLHVHMLRNHYCQRPDAPGMAFIVVSAFTLGTLNLMGMPVASVSCNVEHEAVITDAMGHEVGRYTGTGSGRAYWALYWGYDARSANQQARSEAFTNALQALSDNLLADRQHLHEALAHKPGEGIND